MLEAECRLRRCRNFPRHRKSSEVTHATEFVVHAANEEFSAPALVVATGGLTIPKMGATDFGYRLARQFGLKIRETRPALDAFAAG